MRKLTLRIEELSIESFTATPGTPASAGTVHAHDSIQYCPSGPSYCGEHQCNTETGACSPTVCGSTCDAAVATCAYSCGYSCGGSCGSECCVSLQFDTCP
jgi:hypothetical protein